MPPGDGSPAGTWAARVARPSGTDAQTLRFTADGRVFLAGGGTGTWTATGPGSFEYRIGEPILDEAGDRVAWVAVEQRARLDGDSFTSSGTSRVRGNDGTPLRTAEVSVTASRVRRGYADHHGTTGQSSRAVLDMVPSPTHNPHEQDPMPSTAAEQGGLVPEQTQIQPQTIPDVRKSVTVRATPDDCFRVFTEQPAAWWPDSHVLVKKERAGLAFEPGVDGRYYEWDVEGTEIDWGRVLEWVPGRRLVMTWRIDPNWQSIPDDERASEIEVDFEPVDAEHTKVSLAHVKLHKHGEGADRIFRALDGPSPGETLERFAKAMGDAA